MSIATARLRRSAVAYPTLTIGVVIVSIVLLITLFAPILAPFSPMTASPDVEAPPPEFAAVPGLLLQSLTGRLAAPVHWFGTDAAGLDIFSRVLTAFATMPASCRVLEIGSTARRATIAFAI